jgi:dienelactone hydrolase
MIRKGAVILVAIACGSLALSQQKNDTASERKDAAPKHVQSEAAKEFRKTAQDVTFPSVGRELKGWLYKPEGKGPFPAIIWNHGSEKQPRAHPELGKFYTSHGFVVFLPVRRGHEPSPGQYIQDSWEAYRKEASDPSKIAAKIIQLQEECNQDVVAAVEWIKKQQVVDAKNIAVTGCSYGGIQTLLASEKEIGVKAFVPFAPAAMTWRNVALRERMSECVRNAKAPVFLIQAKNDYSTGPSEVLGPLLSARGGLYRNKVYPEFGTTPQEGHGGFACWDEGIAIWGNDVLSFLKEAGLPVK